MQGFYSVSYGGQAGLGMALLALHGGKIVGADVAGGLYDGTYIEARERLSINVSVTVPPGVILVTGAAAQTAPYTFQINAVLPASFGGGAPVQVPTPTGLVTATFKKLRDL